MAAIAGTDLGVPWPPVADPDLVGGARATGSPVINLPAGGSPPMATSTATAPLTTVPASTSQQTSAPPAGTPATPVDPSLGRR